MFKKWFPVRGVREANRFGSATQVSPEQILQYGPANDKPPPIALEMETRGALAFRGIQAVCQRCCFGRISLQIHPPDVDFPRSQFGHAEWPLGKVEYGNVPTIQQFNDSTMKQLP
jgi:hypothetical protein